MNKKDFLFSLEKALSGLPKEEVEERLAFYDEIIEDRVEDGLSEEQADMEIGSLDCFTGYSRNLTYNAC